MFAVLERSEGVGKSSRPVPEGSRAQKPKMSWQGQQGRFQSACNHQRNSGRSNERVETSSLTWESIKKSICKLQTNISDRFSRFCSQFCYISLTPDCSARSGLDACRLTATHMHRHNHNCRPRSRHQRTDMASPRMTDSKMVKASGNASHCRVRGS